MLVLTRKKGERIFLGKEIVLTLVEIRGQTVRLGIDAPQAMDVQREEVFLKELKEKRSDRQEPRTVRRPPNGRKQKRGALR